MWASKEAKCLNEMEENVEWRNNISFKKDAEEVALLQVKILIQIIVKFRAKKKLSSFQSCATHSFE